MGFTSFGGAGGPGFSPTAFTTTFTDSAYTATPGERVISNGATVTMPSSPTAGDVVLVGRVGSSSVSIQPNGNELIETADVGYIEQDSTVALISDGSDWYAVDGSEFVSAIPDSVVSRPEDNDSSSSSGRNGMRIKTKAEWKSIQARISANTTTFTDAYITRVSDDTDLLQVDVSGKSSGDVITFSDVNLQTDTEYNITLENDSGDITNGYNNGADAFPYTSDAVDIISRNDGRTTLSQTFVEFGNINL